MSFPQNKVKRSCIEGETSDMVFLETHVTDEVVPENFMDPGKQNNFHLGKSKNLEEETQNFQDRYKVVVPENFMDPQEQNNFPLGKSKNLEKETQNFQDRHKVVIPIEEKPPILKIHSSVLQRKNCNDSNVHSRTVIYLQPLKMVPSKFNVHLYPLPKGTTCFLRKTSPEKPLLSKHHR